MQEAPSIFNPETEEWDPLPFTWAICSRCDGHGKSSAYLGAFTGEQMREDPEFARDYMAGVYDRACDCCGGAGKVKEPDLGKMTPEQHAAWEIELHDRVQDAAAERSERMMDPEYLAELRGGY